MVSKVTEAVMTMIQQEANRMGSQKAWVLTALTLWSYYLRFNSICNLDSGLNPWGITGREKKAAALKLVQAEAMFCGSYIRHVKSLSSVSIRYYRIELESEAGLLHVEHLPTVNSSPPGSASCAPGTQEGNVPHFRRRMPWSLRSHG